MIRPICRRLITCFDVPLSTLLPSLDSLAFGLSSELLSLCLVTVRCLRYLWVLNLSHTHRHPYRNVQSGHIEDLTIGLRCVMVIGVGHREPISSWLQLFCEPKQPVESCVLFAPLFRFWDFTRALVTSTSGRLCTLLFSAVVSSGYDKINALVLFGFRAVLF